MLQTKNTDIQLLRSDLELLLMKLKRNREKVPLEILKTRYKQGYQALCSDISSKTTEYLRKTALSNFRIRKEYADEVVDTINRTIADSGILKQISDTLFNEQSIDKLDIYAGQLKILIDNRMEQFFKDHLAPYITAECFENISGASPDQCISIPLLFCPVNDCILQEGKWVPRGPDTFVIEETK